MSFPSAAPTLADLDGDLARAERSLVCTDMIDNFERRRIETERAQRHLDAIKAQIARIEETM